MAARKAGATDIVRHLPDGFETRLGLRFGGRELSGDEWQKIALARAFFRDCQLLVLDEPTASLDEQAEHNVYRHFSELTRGRMTVIISHRFSTVRMADQIAVLDNGRIRESGTHSELMRRSGLYAKMFEMQAGRYRPNESCSVIESR